MHDALFAYEPLIRLGAFAGVFAVMAVWELLTPRRRPAIGRNWRWPNNLGVMAIDVVLVRILLPITAVGLALIAEARGVGLLNLIALPRWASIVISVVILDLAIYLQHVLFHAVPALWRLHRMHHADLEFDVTTGVRFHPVEILLSTAIKLAVVAALGTPDMHRVHHSILRRETNSNFGFNLPWWDRLLGTYRAQPAAGHEGMTIGIEQFRDARELGLDRMLLQPFRGEAGRYPIAAREAD